MRAFTARRLLRRSAHNPWVTLSGVAAVLALITLAAQGCGGAVTGPDASTPIAPLHFSDIVASADISFEVAFRSDDLYFHAPERFVWRQGNGFVRFDIVASASGEPDMGWIAVENQTDPAAPRKPYYEGYYAMGCLWSRLRSLAPDGAAQVDLSCSSSGSVAGSQPLLFSLMSSSFDRHLPDQSVAGRKASCYSFDDPTMSVAVFCVDSSERIPLLLSTVDVDPQLTQELRALFVSTAQQDLGFPVQLEKNPVTQEWQFEGTVPLSTLQLPDFSQFEQ